LLGNYRDCCVLQVNSIADDDCIDRYWLHVNENSISKTDTNFVVISLKIFVVSMLNTLDNAKKYVMRLWEAHLDSPAFC
jgi:hypothetical protein